ncbi:MAG TPA: hypothetical protein VK524_05520 [Polyangiaceae bacterium]|nr:hypothetical protein [Polyangiaceae bacterium]
MRGSSLPSGRQRLRPSQRLVSVALTLAGVVYAGACGTSSSSEGSSGKGGSAGRGGSAGSSGNAGSAGRPDGSAGDGGSGGSAGNAGTAGIDGSAGTGGTAGSAGKGGSSGTGGGAGKGGSGGSAGDGGVTCAPSLTPCGSACANLDTDARHCGRCGHSCLGGACDTRLCQPVTIATGQYYSYSIAVDATYVYWGRATSAFTTATIARRRIDATDAVANFAPGEAGRGLTAVGGKLYWTYATGGTGAVRTCTAPDCGIIGNLTTYSGTSAGELVVAPAPTNRVYFGQPSPYGTSSGDFWYAPVAGGTATPVASAPNNPSGLTSDANNVYWSNTSTYTNDLQNSDGQILRMSLAGGTPVVLAESLRGDIGDVAVAAGNLYFAGSIWVGTNYPTGIFRVPLPNGVGTSTPLSFVSSLGVQDLVADATHVYFVAGSSVYRCPHSGCSAPPEIIAPGQDTPTSITQDAVSIYWTTIGTWGSPETQVVRRLAK